MAETCETSQASNEADKNFTPTPEIDDSRQVNKAIRQANRYERLRQTQSEQESK